MKIEEEIFQKSKVKEETLLPYGFVKGKKGVSLCEEIYEQYFSSRYLD
ncbi:MAG TPA: hypothetical protein IAC24_01235 [Candidatus Onthousia faecigallinarum]|nr:hypothetical protein [Candidatus Onthousia faecigallinarum]